MSRKLLRAAALGFVLSLIFAAAPAISGEPPKKAPQAEVDPFGPPAANDNAPAAGKKQATADSDAGVDLFGDPIARPAKPRPAAKPAARPAAKPRPQAARKPSTRLKLHGGEKAILRALKKPAALEYAEVPLKDILDDISAKYRIPVYLDHSGMKDAGVDYDTPVTCDLSGISLQSALETILDEMQLKWTIHNEMLYITSPAMAESDEFMYAKSYDVTDLVVPIIDGAINDNPLSTPDAMRLDSLVHPMFTNPPNPLFMGSGPPPGVGAASQTAPLSTVAANIGVAAAYGARDYGQFLRSPTATIDYQPLKDAITNTVAIKSWMDNGGSGTISDVPPGFLVISQTRAIHQQVGRFLASLRARQRNSPSFRVDLCWLWLDSAHRDSLFGSRAPKASLHGALVKNEKRLIIVARDVPHLHASLSCVNGIAGSFAAGDRRALIVDALPAVDTGVAYQPIVSMPNVGVKAEVLSTLVPGTRSATFYIHSSITRWTPSRPPVVIRSAFPAGMDGSIDVPQSAAGAPVAGKTGSSAAAVPALNGSWATPKDSHAYLSSHGPGSSSCPIDLPVMPTQEFDTTLRVPLGKPVVVGSVTFAPEGGAGLDAAKKDAVEVYLIATTSIIKPAKKTRR